MGSIKKINMDFTQIFGFLREGLKIFNLFNTKEMKEAKKNKKEQEVKDNIEKALKKGDHEKLDKIG